MAQQSQYPRVAQCNICAHEGWRGWRELRSGIDTGELTRAISYMQFASRLTGRFDRSRVAVFGRGHIPWRLVRIMQYLSIKSRVGSLLFFFKGISLYLYSYLYTIYRVN